jgi:hypothetical protein
MKRLLLPMLAALALPTAVEANLFQKEPTYEQIVSQCKRPGLKYAEYSEIGMTQFAKNYLDLCIKTEAQKVLQAKYKKCLKKIMLLFAN